MWRVNVMGQAITCDRYLPGDPLSVGARFDLEIRAAPTACPSPVRWIGSSDWPRIAVSDESVILEFTGDVTFEARRASQTMRYWLHRELDDATFAHEVTDAALPRWLAARGQRVLHGSSVAGRNGAIVLCGESGAGKSTFAATLASRGYAFLGDDAALMVLDSVGRVRVVPARTSLRLYEDSAVAAFGAPRLGAPMADWSSKLLVDPRSNGVDVAAAPLPLTAVIGLEWADGPPLIERLDGGGLFELLARNSFDLPDDSPLAGVALLDRWGDTAGELSGYRLRRRAEFTELDELVALVSPILDGS